MKIQRLHPWQVTPKEAIEIQRNLRSKFGAGDVTREVRFVAGADASFSRQLDRVRGAVCIFSLPDLKLIEQETATLPLKFPYIPGFLSFCEGPVLLECFERVEDVPDVIIFDGQGIMHPRRMGIATHLGILLNNSSIGCAKTHLYGEFTYPANAKGAYTYVRDEEHSVIGACVRTRANVKPVFVSVGNKLDLNHAIDIILQCTPKYRIPEPLRFAHALADSEESSR
jgi:deoxyribonuclease V